MLLFLFTVAICPFFIAARTFILANRFFKRFPCLLNNVDYQDFFILVYISLQKRVNMLTRIRGYSNGKVTLPEPPLTEEVTETEKYNKGK
jgi:hypothetical protein